MPAKNPRLTITLQPSLAAQLRRISELTGNSQSSLISELLEGSGPTFERLIKVLEAASDVKASFKGSMASDLAEAQTKMEGQLGLSLDAFDDATKPLLDEAEKIRRRTRRVALARDVRAGAVAEASTPMSNRGVRSTRKTGQLSNEKRGGKHGSI